MTDEIPPDDERYVASEDREIATPTMAEQQGIEELPEDILLFNEGCPHTDDPQDGAHNLHKAQKFAFRDTEIVLILYAKCSCGFERRRVI